MKVQVDIVAGFLGSGKTTFINGLLENKKRSGERIVVIQCEAGEIEIEGDLPEGNNLIVIKLEKGRQLDERFIERIIGRYLPERIIIELNGMTKTEEVLAVFDSRDMRKGCKIARITSMVDAATFEVFVSNMSPVFTDQLSSSDLIVITNSETLTKEKLNTIEHTLSDLNKSAKIVRAVIAVEESEAVSVEPGYFQKSPPWLSKPSDKLFAVFITLLVGYLIYIVFSSAGVQTAKLDLTWLQVLNTVFLSILIQAFPFILIGVFISAIMQVLISNDTIIKLFPKKTFLGFAVAIFAGVFFPVCDCAIVPVAARLVKKGVPLPAAVTFMLAAPIVNPIVIASTLYAFPGQPEIAAYRIYIGVAVALAVGVAFLLFPAGKGMLLNSLEDHTCKCGCGAAHKTGKSLLEKIEAIFRHAGSEFFEVGRYLIVGVFLSAIFQTFVPKDAFSSLGGGYAGALLVMMLLAFILSVCSTSDAFIARSFTNQFPMGAIMGFMVLGPMLDIKNLLMLTGSFNKKFVIRLVLLVVSVSFLLLLILTGLLF